MERDIVQEHNVEETLGRLDEAVESLPVEVQKLEAGVMEDRMSEIEYDEGLTASVENWLKNSFIPPTGTDDHLNVSIYLSKETEETNGIDADYGFVSRIEYSASENSFEVESEANRTTKYGNQDRALEEWNDLVETRLGLYMD